MDAQTIATESVPRQWRDEAPASKPISRSRKRFVVAALFLVLVGIFAAMVSWITSPPDPLFLPIWITEYQDRRIPFPAMADRDRTEFHKGDYFARYGANGAAAQEGHRIRKQLNQLRESSADQVVVFLSGHARRTTDGALHVLPADALPGDSNTWIPFREILEELRECPAAHKLLVVDLMRPWIDATLGILQHDTATAVAAELPNVEDANRLVLCSCSPGQFSLESEELGRSVFLYYLQEGLLGYADGYGDGLRNGVITVRELAAFATARVDRWSRQNRNQRQTPILFGEGRDFPLAALPYQKPRPHLQPAPQRKYPDWLAKGWSARDAWLKSKSVQFAPRVYRIQQKLLQLGEQYWRGFIPEHRIQENIVTRFQRLAPMFAQRAKLAGYQPTSLAQAEYLGLSADATTAKNVDDAFTKFFAALAKAKAAAKGKPVSPAEMEKLTADFQKQTKALPSLAVSQAAFQHAVNDAKHQSSTIAALADLLQTPMRPQPAFVETLLLRQLDVWASRAQPGAWSAPLIDQILHVVKSSESALTDPDVYPWIEPLLAKLQRIRHEGEMRLWARGYVSLDEATTALQQARALASGVSDQVTTIQGAYSAMNDAFALLPIMVAYLDAAPASGRTWRETVHSAAGLYEQLQSHSNKSLSLDERIDAINKKTLALRQFLGDLSAPFTKDPITQLIQRAKGPTAKGDVYQQLDSLLMVPHPALDSKTRVMVWDAARSLARRLNEGTIQLDHDEDTARIQTITPDAVLSGPLHNAQTAAAFKRLSNSLALLNWAGLPDGALKKTSDASAGKHATIPELGKQLQTLWSRGLHDQYREEKSAQAQTRMSWFVPPLETFVDLDQANPAPVIRLRLRKLRRQWQWLSNWYGYLSRDYRGAGADLIAGDTAADFYSQVANANGALASMQPQPIVGLAKIEPIKPLGGKQSSATVMLKLRRFEPSGKFPKLSIKVAQDETGWLRIFPAKIASPIASAVPKWAEQSVGVPISLQPAAKRTSKSPKGILIRATVEDHSFHILAPTPIASAVQDVQILVSSNPKKPEPVVNEIRLRPGGVRQKFYVYLKNPTDTTRNIVASAGGASVKETLAPKSIKRLAFPIGKAVKVGMALPAFTSPLTIQVGDAKTLQSIAAQAVPIRIASPREYVGVTDIRYDPGGLPPGNNKLSVTLAALAAIPVPDIPVGLTLPASRIPSLRGIGGGTFSGNLSTKQGAPPLTLFAQKLKLVPAKTNTGYVYIAVDGVPRAFIYRTTLSLTGETLTPRGDVQPGLRVSAPGFAKADTVFKIPVEVDNAPPKAKLTVEIGRRSVGGFQADLSKKFDAAKERRIGFAIAPDGALWFDAAISDWAVAVDASQIQGPRLVRAQLLDQYNNEILTAMQPIVVDGTPPSIVRFVDPPKQVKKGTVLKFQAVAADPESGIKSVAFFIGRPVKGKLPDKTPLILAKPTTGESATWSALVQLPEKKIGTTAVSVQATNRVGLSSFATVDLELTATDLAKTGPGRIVGIVTEGRLPQAGLEVVLYEKGKVKAKTKTKKDGSYAFANLKPGKYGVYCFKPSTRRQAKATVIVAPNQTANTPLKLAL